MLKLTTLNPFYLVVLIGLSSLSTSCIPAPPSPEDQSFRSTDQDTVSSLPADQFTSDEDVLLPEVNSCERSIAPERSWSGVIYELRFGREDPVGVSVGHNIDGRVSDTGDAEGCFRSDLSSPSGQAGIDNQFSKILPLIEAVGGEAIEGLVQGIINQGRLLLMFELSGLDDLDDDDCVHFDLFYGRGTPQIGNQGVIVSGQTFDRDLDKPSVSAERATLQDGIIEVGGLSLILPLQVFDQFYLLDVGRVSFYGAFNHEGELHGYLSGAIDVEAVSRRVEMIEGGGMVAELIPNFLRQQADLAPDENGVCQELSVTLTFKAKKAYLYEVEEESGSEGWSFPPQEE